MKNESFIINNEKLYCEQILIFCDLPLLFICVDEKENHYIVLCSDSENLDYIISKVSVFEILNLLNKKITMREIFVQSSEKWRIKTAELKENDLIEKVNSFSDSELPDENVYFEIFDEKLFEYKKNLTLKLIYSSICENFLKVSTQFYFDENFASYVLPSFNFVKERMESYEWKKNVLGIDDDVPHKTMYRKLTR